MADKALIFGITGQDGSYLTELLLDKGYEVHGVVRRSSTFNTSRIDHLYVDPREEGARLFLHFGDLSDGDRIADLIDKIRPDEIYNLGAQSHVQVSFDIPEYTGDVTALGVTRLLDAVKRSGNSPRVYQASSSEMFGLAPAPQSESSKFMPQSPYAVAKLYAHWMINTYREGHGLYACSGILFNHESPRRGETFVTRKITRAIARIIAGRQDVLYLGNLDAVRDWGYAPEYVNAMWKMLQLEQPEDFVIGTGESHSVREFLDEAFGYVGLDSSKYVKFDSRYLRPAEVPDLRSDTINAREKLGWEPKIGFKKLTRIMVDADMAREGLDPVGDGRSTINENFGAWHQWQNSILDPLALSSNSLD